MFMPLDIQEWNKYCCYLWQQYFEFCNLPNDPEGIFTPEEVEKAIGGIWDVL
jgi:hypothetical protein